MTLRHSIIVLALVAWAAGTPALAQSGAGLAARSSDAGGVRVVVTPKTVAPGATWEFEVVMDTHTKPLDADLTKAAVLLDDGKRAYAPTVWQGDPPGGHHRKGLLRFPAPAGQTKSFEVQIEGIGSPGKRTFQWTVN